MDDFSAIAARIAVSVGQLRGCIILTRDGLVVGSFPPSDESPVQRAWLRFAALGDPEKGFVEFGDELWVYVRRGPYAAFVLAEASARPGLVIDQLEQLLLTAEEARSKRDALKLPEAADAPKSKPRTPLHKSSGQPVHQPSVARAEAQGAVSHATPPSQASAPQSSEHQPRPLSWILAPDAEETPPATPERRPVSWILAPQEEESVKPAPKHRSENQSWILMPPEQGDGSAPPAPEPASAPHPVSAPHPASAPEPAPPIEPAPEPEPQVPDTEREPEFDVEFDVQPQREREGEVEPQKEGGGEVEPQKEGGEVDRFTLAQEFSKLLGAQGFE
jgi:hypothetical protein